MKPSFLIVAVLSLILPVNVSAQRFDTREPGIYAIVRGESIPLNYTSSPSSRSSSSGITRSTDTFYKGLSSGVIADATFVLVNDPERSVYTASDPFIKSLTPEDMGIARLDVNPEKKRRELTTERALTGDDVELVFTEGGLGFEYEQISDNSYKIKVYGLEPGEYGIAFRFPSTRYIEYQNGVFGFTIPKGYLEGRITEMNTPTEQGVTYADIPPARQKEAEKGLKEGGYKKVLWQIDFGYINKSWVCNYPSMSQREEFFGDGGKFMHGWNFGILFTPSTDWGLGLRAGIFGEAYISKSARIKEYCRDFGEFDLYVPLHASYRIPFKKDVALEFFGGPGFQWVIFGEYNNPTGAVWTGRRPNPQLTNPGKHIYGNGWPERTNWQAELGVKLRYERLGVSFTYGLGLVNHHLQNSFDGGLTFETATTSRQDKMQLTISLIL